MGRADSSCDVGSIQVWLGVTRLVTHQSEHNRDAITRYLRKYNIFIRMWLLRCVNVVFHEVCVYVPRCNMFP